VLLDVPGRVWPVRAKDYFQPIPGYPKACLDRRTVQLENIDRGFKPEIVDRAFVNVWSAESSRLGAREEELSNTIGIGKEIVCCELGPGRVNHCTQIEGRAPAKVVILLRSVNCPDVSEPETAGAVTLEK